jgi:hypothetical protein
MAWRTRSPRFNGRISHVSDVALTLSLGRRRVTSLDNLILLCRRHYRVVHEGGFTIARAADGLSNIHQPSRRAIAAGRAAASVACARRDGRDRAILSNPPPPLSYPAGEGPCTINSPSSSWQSQSFVSPFTGEGMCPPGSFYR